MRELTGGVGVEFAFSAIGAPSGIDQAIRMCAYAGTATLVGMPKPDTKLDVDLAADIFGPRPTIAVTHGGDTIPQEDFPFLAQAALDGRLDLARFVTSTISLNEVPDRLPRIGQGGEITHPGPVRITGLELLRQLERQPSLTCAAGSGHGDESMGGHKLSRRSQIGLSSRKARQRRGQIASDFGARDADRGS